MDSYVALMSNGMWNYIGTFRSYNEAHQHAERMAMYEGLSVDYVYTVEQANEIMREQAIEEITDKVYVGIENIKKLCNMFEDCENCDGCPLCKGGECLIAKKPYEWQIEGV